MNNFEQITSINDIRLDCDYLVGSISSGDDYFTWQIVRCRRPGILKINDLDDIPDFKLSIDGMHDSKDDYIADDDDLLRWCVVKLPRWIPGLNDAYMERLRAEAQAEELRAR